MEPPPTIIPQKTSKFNVTTIITEIIIVIARGGSTILRWILHLIRTWCGIIE